MKLSRYNPLWVSQFEEEAELLKSVLGSNALNIEHVGSTAVPELQAKPVIDIQISVESPDQLGRYQPALERAGYRHLPTESPPVEVYPFFHKPSRWPTTHHVHLCKFGSDEEKAHIAFRNWLRTHSEDRVCYGKLKDKLALKVDDQDVKTLFRYTEEKSAWVLKITAQALKAGFAD